MQSRDPLVIARLAGSCGLRPDRRGNEGEDFVLVEPLHAHVLVDVPGAVQDIFGEVAGAADGAEAEGRGGQVLGDAVFGEGVEEGGGGAVGGLAVVPEDGGERAEHEEEVEISEAVVEVPGTFNLGRDHFGVFFVG